MQKTRERNFLIVYNSIYKENDQLYHHLARHFGLSDCAFWILYILRETEKIYTQKEICNLLFLSKQTVNSALKKLEKNGYIVLSSNENNKKNKQILLTQTGEKLMQNTIDPILKIEEKAFARFSEKECNLFLNMYHQYLEFLKEEAGELLCS
ncbi:MarR family winged helix-turn-helix transcriptional regulator [Ructibacterium gallinarum]|uniref:Winged helix-turn-helix transcriptional regulator n=1 Tax=Ructibacterium gallinarum TaxID=2779355 RepID=A0A9D5R885_9FIRM|nr:MarR family transcriptional regulator [Ructibacterium gallinarum]MBE5040151.1 winged helix-turn-helix transcriptional regulator [Ructibacterium gallinarum]